MRIIELMRSELEQGGITGLVIIIGFGVVATMFGLSLIIAIYIEDSFHQLLFSTSLLLTCAVFSYVSNGSKKFSMKRFLSVFISSIIASLLLWLFLLIMTMS